MGETVPGKAVPATNVYVPQAPGEDLKPGAYQIDGRSTAEQISPWSAPTGGYAYDPDKLNSIAKKFDDLAADYIRDLDAARAIATATGPGLEYASVNNADDIQNSGNALLQSLKDRANYCMAQAERYRQAAGKYAAKETDNSMGSIGGALPDATQNLPEGHI